MENPLTTAKFQVLIRQNADIVKRLQEGNFFNGSAGDQRLLGNHQRAVSNSLTATNTAAVILRERSNGANSAAAGLKKKENLLMSGFCLENAKQTQKQQRQQSQPPQAIKRKLRESPATDKVAAVHPTMGRCSVGREIRCVSFAFFHLGISHLRYKCFVVDSKKIVKL